MLKAFEALNPSGTDFLTIDLVCNVAEQCSMFVGTNCLKYEIEMVKQGFSSFEGNTINIPFNLLEQGAFVSSTLKIYPAVF